MGCEPCPIACVSLLLGGMYSITRAKELVAQVVNCDNRVKGASWRDLKHNMAPAVAEISG